MPPTSVPLRRRHRLLVLSAGIASVALLAGCAPGGVASSGSSSAPASTEVPEDEEITLTLAHFELGGLSDAIDNLIAEYEELHPNVTIETSFTSFNDYGQRIKLQMSSDDAPDIAEVGQAFTMMGPLVEGGLLRPLDDYAELYGWADRFGPGLLDQSRFEPDGSKFGSGDLYGLALGGNMVGIFYNRDIVEQLGVEVPFETLADFEAAMQAASDAGITPVSLGNAEGWPANHTHSSLLSQYVPQDELVSWIYGDEGASFTADPFVEGTQALADWNAAGYFGESPNGLSNDDALSRFSAGDTAFFITGNWSLATVEEQMGDSVGFAAVPPLEAGGPARATGATTSPFAISSRSEHPDVAANFIDFMTGPDAVDILAEGGYAPLVPGADTSAATPLGTEFNDVWSNVVEQDGLTLYLDWATVGMGNTLFPALQELLGDQTDAQQLTERVQAEWENDRP
jgi:raffinose/stachyose/melibiose transport system substrate-binding protein